MRVRLTGITRPVVDDIPDTASLLAHHARVSNTANQGNHETGPKLLRSLIRRKEWSPLEMVHLTMEIETTRDVARQMLRHRSFSFQEFSQRYSEVDDDPVFREARLQHPTDRQASVECEPDRDWDAMQEVAWEQAIHAYRYAIHTGIAKEVARAVLPEGMTRSLLYMAGSLRSWVHYCELRCDEKTQKEHRLIAQEVRSIILKEFPMLEGVF